MHHIAEELVSGVARLSHRPADLALTLQLQEKKHSVSDQTGSVVSSRTSFFSAEMTADLQPPLISFICFAKWWQAGEEEVGLVADVAGVSCCCLGKLPGAAS